MMPDVALKTLTYTSLARLDLEERDLLEILTVARDLNAIDGITGLLIFNGTHFLQVLEGAPDALDELLERIRRDSRHSDVEVREERPIEGRSFPDWSMRLVKVRSAYFAARQTQMDELPGGLSDRVRLHILELTELISGEVDFRR